MSCDPNCDDIQTIIVTLNTGAPGSSTGIPGPQGPQGEQGEQGPQGEPGIMSAVTGDVSITTTSVSTLATVGVAAIVGGAAQALTLQTDTKGRVLAVTAQQASITTTQVQGLVIPELSNAAGAALATAGASGISGASARADHVHPFPSAADVGALGATAAAGGDLTGNFPNPTLAAVTTAQSGVGSASAVPVLTVDDKGRVTALNTVALNALTTQDIAGLTTEPAQSLGAVASAGISPLAARGDHIHPLPSAADVGALGATAAAGGDLTGNFPNPTLAAITTAQSGVGSQSVVPVISIDAKGRVTALTTAAISGGAALTTSPAVALAPTATSGSSNFAARADHVHPYPSTADLGAVSKSGDTMAGKLIAAATTTQALLNIGGPLGTAGPTTIADGDVWISNQNRLSFRSGGVTINAAGLSQANTFNQPQVIGSTANAAPVLTVSNTGSREAIVASAQGTSPAVRITQTGSGEALRVEDETTPDATAFVVTNSGRVGIGVAVSTTETAALTVDGGGIKFSDGSMQTAAVQALTTQQIAGLSTTAPLSLAPTATAGSSNFAARADHVHALTTLGTPGTFGSGTVVPVLTVDNYGRVSAVTTTEITGGGGGASLTTQPAQSLATTASAGVSTEAARADHVHPYPTPAQIGAISTTAQAGFATTTQLANYAPLESPALTGSPTAPTAAAGTDTTQLATTAFVQSNRGDRYKATSTTPLTIGNGVKTLTVETGLSYTVTQEVSIVYDLDNHMHGVVTSYNGSTLVVEVSQHSGSGSFSAWVINVGGLTTAAGALLSTNNLSDVASTTTALTNLGGVSTGRQIIAGSGLTGGGDFTADRTMSLTTSGVTAGSYNTTAQLATLTVDQFGRVTNVSQQAFPTGVNFTRVKVVGQDAATVQGCIDAITTATYNAQWWVLIPPGEYTENLTLKACVNLAALGTNNGVSRITQINGSHTYAGSATAANNYIQISGISLNGNSSGTPALSLTSTGGNSSLVHLLDCRIVHPGAQTSEVVVRVGSKVFVTAFNVTTASVTATGQGGTHWDINNGSVEAHCCRNIGGTRAVLLRGSDGTAYYPYLDSRNSYWEGSGSETIKIDSTGTNALAVFGNSNIKTTGSGVTNGIDIQAAGALVGASSTSYQVPVGASNYVVTGVAGSGYFEANNHYSNTAALPYYSTQFGASVLRQQYATANLTTTQAVDLRSSTTPAAIGTAAVGTGVTFARADHVHALTTAGVSNILRTTPGAALTTTAIAGVSSFVARLDHTHPLPTAGQIGALTTDQINSLSTATPATLTTSGVVGLSVYPARMDHSHAMATLGVAATYGSSSAVPVITTDAFGRVASVTTAAISGGGGASLTTVAAANLTTTGIAGISTEAARADHSHALTTSAVANIVSNTAGAALTTTAIAGVSPFVARVDHTHAIPTTFQLSALFQAGAYTAHLTTQGEGVLSGGNLLIGQSSQAPYVGRTAIKENQLTIDESSLLTGMTSIQSTAVVISDSACSSDGRVVAFVGISGTIGFCLISTNYGATYASRNLGTSGISKIAVSMSADGKYITVAQYNGPLSVSSDFGATFANKDSTRNWSGIAMSADGRRQLACVNTSGLVYVSSNFGQTWTSVGSANSWSGAAMSSDGRVMFVTNGGNVYASTNFGSSFALTGATVSGGTNPKIFCSANGQNLFIVDALIDRSLNFGSTSTIVGSSTGASNGSCSASGNLVASTFSGVLKVSTDFGATFSTRDSSVTWVTVCMSADGKYSFAATSGNIYRSVTKTSLTGSLAVSDKAAIGVALTTTETASLAVGSGGIKAWNAALTAAPTITVGDATPEGAVTAPVGSLFLRTNGGTGTTLYVKESGTGNTGWVGK